MSQTMNKSTGSASLEMLMHGLESRDSQKQNSSAVFSSPPSSSAPLNGDARSLTEHAAFSDILGRQCSVTDMLVKMPSWITDLRALQRYLTDKEEALESRAAELESRVMQLDTAKLEVQASTAPLIAQRDAAVAQSNALEAKTVGLEVEVAELNRRLREAESVQDQVARMQATHQKQVKALEDRNTALLEENRTLMEQISRNSQELSNMQHRYQDSLNAHKEERRKARASLVEAIKLAAQAVATDSQPDICLLEEIVDVNSQAAKEREIRTTSVTSPQPTPSFAHTSPQPSSQIASNGEAPKSAATNLSRDDSVAVSGRKRQRTDMDDRPSQPAGIPYQADSVNVSSNPTNISAPEMGAAEYLEDFNDLQSMQGLEASIRGHDAPETSAVIERSSQVDISRQSAIALSQGEPASAGAGTSLVDTSGTDAVSSQAIFQRLPSTDLVGRIEQAVLSKNVSVVAKLWKDVYRQIHAIMEGRAGNTAGAYLQVALGARDGTTVNIGRDHPTKTAEEGPSTGMKDPKVSRKQLTVILDKEGTGATVTNYGMNVVYVIKPAEMTGAVETGVFPRGRGVPQNESCHIEDGDHLVFCSYNVKDLGFISQDPFRPKPGHHFIYQAVKT